MLDRVGPGCFWILFALLACFQTAAGQPEFFPIENGTELVYTGYQFNSGRGGPNTDIYDTVTLHFDSVKREGGNVYFRKVIERKGISAVGPYVQGKYVQSRAFTRVISPATGTVFDSLSNDFGYCSLITDILVNDTATETFHCMEYGNTRILYSPRETSHSSNQNWVANYTKGLGLVYVYFSYSGSPDSWRYALKKKDGVDLNLKFTSTAFPNTEYVAPSPFPDGDTSRIAYFPIQKGDVMEYAVFSTHPSHPTAEGTETIETNETVEVRFDSVTMADSSVSFVKTVFRKGIRIQTKHQGGVMVAKDTLPTETGPFTVGDTVSHYFGKDALAESLMVDGKKTAILSNSCGRFPFGWTFWPDSASPRTLKEFEWTAIYAEDIGTLEVGIKLPAGPEYYYTLTKVNGKSITPAYLLYGPFRLTSRFPEINKPSSIRSSNQGRLTTPPFMGRRFNGYDLVGRWFPAKADPRKEIP